MTEAPTFDEASGETRSGSPSRCSGGVTTVWFRAASLVVVFLVLAYYLWTAASNGSALVSYLDADAYYPRILNDEIDPLRSAHYGYYNLMADSFLAGQIALLIRPPPELLALPDPYDPGANEPYRLHDASLYRGRYYLYFGPVPALVLFVPFRVLHLGKITEPFAVALFASGAFICSALILFRLSRRLISAVSPGAVLVATMALGVSNSLPFLLRRPVVYEVAISAAAFFVMLGFYFLIRTWNKERPSPAGLLAASLCWGLSVGCRPVHVIAGVVLFGIWSLLYFRSSHWTFRQAGLDAACLFLPFGFCLLALGVYNHVRFDSWTEFGTNCNLAGIPPHPEALFRVRNILPMLRLDALSAPRLDFDFPFVHLRSDPSFYTVEPIAGFLLSSPVIWLLGGIGIRRMSGVRIVAALLAAFGFSTLLFRTFLMFGTSMRYQLDYIFPLLLASLLVWLSLDTIIPAGILRSVYRLGAILLLVVGISTHLCFGLTGYYDLFKRSNPRLYFALEDSFSPVTRLLMHFNEKKSPVILDQLTDAGKDSFYFRLFSPKDATYRFMADFSVNPVAGTTPGVRLRVRGGNAAPLDSTILNNSHLEWALPVRRGVYRLEFSASPLTPAPAGVDTRYVMAISNVCVIDHLTGEVVD